MSNVLTLIFEVMFSCCVNSLDIQSEIMMKAMNDLNVMGLNNCLMDEFQWLLCNT